MQWPIEKKAGLAEHVIENGGSLARLNEKAERLYISLTGGNPGQAKQQG
jgi:hypothetical protein